MHSLQWLKAAGRTVTGASIITVPVAGSVLGAAPILAEQILTQQPAAASCRTKACYNSPYDLYVHVCTSRDTSTTKSRARTQVIPNGPGLAEYGFTLLSVSASANQTNDYIAGPHWITPSWDYGPTTGTYKVNHKVCAAWYSGQGNPVDSYSRTVYGCGTY